MKTIFVLIVLILLKAISCHADSTDSSTTKSEKKDGFVPLPLIIYTPETKFAAIFGAYYYKDLNPGNPNAKPLELNAYALYSQKKQIVLQLGFINYFMNNNLLIKADGMYDRYYDNYWGIGPNTLDEDEEGFAFDKVHLRCGLMYQVLPLVYAGLSYHYFNYYNLNVKPDEQLATQKVLGYDGAVISGPGVHIFSDKTNSVFFPTKGYNFDFKYNYFLESFGSTSDFWRSELDVRYFVDLGKENVLAFNGLVTLSEGDVPFEKLSLLGGSQICRGIFEGRYRDKNLYSLQAEYRFPIYWRFAGAAFCAVGDVAPKIPEFELDNMKLAYGLGIRFIALKKEHVAIRLDVANSLQGLQFYLNIKEAF